MPKLRPDSTWLDWLGLGLLWLFSLIVLLGYGTFGRHPELLARAPSAAAFWGEAFFIFSQGHVLVSFAVLAALLTPRTGVKWLVSLIVAGSISLGMELMGTATGFPFSGYKYTDYLGYRIADLVPALIPISWFMMAFPSYVLARRMISGPALQIVFAAILLTIWDLTLDPAMSDLTKYWVWETPGPYYGMPLINLVGWLGTGVLIMSAFHVIGVGKIADQIPTHLMELYYITVIILSLGMTLLAGYWLAILLTLAAFVGIRIRLAVNKNKFHLQNGLHDTC